MFRSCEMVISTLAGLRQRRQVQKPARGGWLWQLCCHHLCMQFRSGWMHWTRNRMWRGWKQNSYGCSMDPQRRRHDSYYCKNRPLGCFVKRRLDSMADSPDSSLEEAWGSFSFADSVPFGEWGIWNVSLQVQVSELFSLCLLWTTRHSRTHGL